MLHDVQRLPSDLPSLSKSLARQGAARDADGGFPTEAFADLARRGLVDAPPIGPAEMRELLLVLAAVGRGDLSVGRIYEGHVKK